LRKSLNPDFAKVSHSTDHIEAEWGQLKKQILEFKKSLKSELNEALLSRRYGKLLSFVRWVKELPVDDASKPLFMELAREIKRGLKGDGRRRLLPFDRAYKEYSRLDKVLENLNKPSVKNKESGKPKIPIFISFHWHLHQPIYWPYEDVVKTAKEKRYTFDLLDVFYSREGVYKSWISDAVNFGKDMDNMGVQVSLSGSLIENLNVIEESGLRFHGWQRDFKKANSLKTKLGNPKMDLLLSGYHHPMLPLIGYKNSVEQIKKHRKLLKNNFGEKYFTRGFFPPENAFANWMIPSLVDQGIQWVLVDNHHVGRAMSDYPWTEEEKVFAPNRSDQRNFKSNKWARLSGIWAPSKVTADMFRPHYVEYMNPLGDSSSKMGNRAKMICVPASRYISNEDIQGGFGPRELGKVLDGLHQFNTDKHRPLLVVINHDGDNYAGGSYDYYHDRFYALVNWVKQNSDKYRLTTIQDYLELYPPKESDVIHVEPGSWIFGDNGDPAWHKWMAKPDPETGYSHDINSWGTMIAARNYMHTMEKLRPFHPKTRLAWDYMLVAETSSYAYWDGTESWDSHATRACNKVIELARSLLGDLKMEEVGPSILMPQRTPYNPGMIESGDAPESTDVKVWTYVFDVSELKEVNLVWRPLGTQSWSTQKMRSRYVPSQTVPRPIIKANEYSGVVRGLLDTTIEYYVEAVDGVGNRSISQYNRVYIGKLDHQRNPGYFPLKPTKDDEIIIVSDRPGFVHWGVNNWTAPPEKLWPGGSFRWSDNKAVESRLIGPDEDGKYKLKLGPVSRTAKRIRSIEYVFHYLDNKWGSDRQILINH
jgi:hypothetical protein